MANNFFKWQPEKFSIGVGLMDSEHERLISIMNNLHHKFLNNESKSELMKVIKQLGDFVVMHFKHEEEYFMKIPNYIYKDAHKSLHTQLINKFTDHVNAFEKNKELEQARKSYETGLQLAIKTNNSQMQQFFQEEIKRLSNL